MGVSQDVQTFSAYSHFLWSTPLELLLSTLLLFFVLGEAMLGGIAVLLVSFWFGMRVSRIMKSLQERLLRDKDARMSIVSEVLNVSPHIHMSIFILYPSVHDRSYVTSFSNTAARC